MIQVILLVLFNGKLRNSRNIFIVNLAIANLCLGSIIIPLLFIPVLNPLNYPYGSTMCKISNALPGMNCYVSTLTIAMMAIERCGVVTD